MCDGEGHSGSLLKQAMIICPIYCDVVHPGLMGFQKVKETNSGRVGSSQFVIPFVTMKPVPFQVEACGACSLSRSLQLPFRLAFAEPWLCTYCHDGLPQVLFSA